MIPRIQNQVNPAVLQRSSNKTVNRESKQQQSLENQII